MKAIGKLTFEVRKSVKHQRKSQEYPYPPQSTRRERVFSTRVRHPLPLRRCPSRKILRRVDLGSQRSEITVYAGRLARGRVSRGQPDSASWDTAVALFPLCERHPLAARMIGRTKNDASLPPLRKRATLSAVKRSLIAQQLKSSGNAHCAGRCRRTEGRPPMA